MIPPSVTLVTSCYDLTRFHHGCRPIEEFKTSFNILLSVPCYLVIYGDKKTIPVMKEIREQFGLTELTFYVQKEYEELETTAYLDKVRENRSKYWPTRDERTCSESHLLCCAKFFFLKEAMKINHFDHERFGWIDCNLKLPNTTSHIKICENYSPEKLLRAIEFTKVNKFHIQAMNVLDKKYKDPRLKSEMYRQYQWVVTGCFFTFGHTIGNRVLDRLIEVFHETTMAGYGHGEEMFFLEVLDEFYDDIHKSYGDYGQIINNYEFPVSNIHYIWYLILKKYEGFQYHREAADCANALIQSVKNYNISLDYGMYIELLIIWYSATLEKITPEEAAKNALEIVSICASNPLLRAKFVEKNEYYVKVLGIDPKFS